MSYVERLEDQLSGLEMDATKMQRRIDSLSAGDRDKDRQIESLQAKVHLCAAYDKLEAENRSIKEAAKWVCRDATYNDYNDVCEVSVPSLEHLENVLASVSTQQSNPESKVGQ